MKLRTKRPETEQAHASEHSAKATAVVGIGASAGGLEALKNFLGAMPSDSGLAFVVVQHLEPTHESRMAEILAKSTAMKVVQAADGMPVEPNVVFTNPPGRSLRIQEGKLVLDPPSERQHVVAAIDHFLSSLAEDQQENAIGIILSGSSGQDGPRGILAIRAGGGMSMAQDPQEAQFPAMPQMAIDTGLIDYVLPAAEMPTALTGFVESRQGSREKDDRSPAEAEPTELDAIIKLLRVGTNSDFRHYKRATILRRIQRRMGLRQISGIEDYVKRLQSDPGELVQLGKDMLISVSSFFRDANAFENLAGVIKGTLADEGRDPDAPVRAWVAGCATGEEAYSVAMLLLDASREAGRPGRVQVFASDVDESGLETARAGLYPESIDDEVTPDRIQRYFTKQGHGYRVGKLLREAVVFSRHNLLSDPPFSKLDLISCRNVLIYLDPAAHKRVLSMFSFALNVGGHLFLGKAEGISGLEEYFEPVSPQSRIYRLARSNRRGAADFPLATDPAPRQPVERERTQFVAAGLSQANQEALLEHFKASLVLIDGQGKILYFHGQTERYLGHPKGLASLNILDLTEGALSARLRRAIDQVLKQGEPVTFSAASLPREGAPMANLTVRRLADPGAGGSLLAVIFEDARMAESPAALPTGAAQDEPLVAQLEGEVRILRRELLENGEEYNAANEELKTASEEVMSMNEELQSANEELEASKEELQSLNEELNTVNSQLNESVNELTLKNDDLSNLMSATEIATVFVDGGGRITRFTPNATQLLNLIGSDVGRPVSHITQNFKGVDLAGDLLSVLKNLAPLEREVSAPEGRWFTLRIIPYRTQDNRIDGAVITFSDVTRLKQMEFNLQFEKCYVEDIVETVRHPLIVLNRQLQLLSANRSFYKMFDIEPVHVEKQRIYDLLHQRWDITRLRQLFEEVIPKTPEFENFRVDHELPGAGRRMLLVSGRCIQPERDLPERILISIEDITEREEVREALEAFNTRLEEQVAERTELAEQRLRQLRELTVQMIQSEQRERERLARVLHDNLQQLLVGARFPLRTIRNHTEDKHVLKAVDVVEELLTQMLATSRSLTSDLSPSILYQSGLDAALPWLARRMQEEHGLDVVTQIDAKVELDDRGVVVLLFQAARELLLNIVKHAGVDTAHMQLDKPRDGGVRIVVRDEGAGFDTASDNAERGTGLGLFGWIERLQHIGGSCKIESRPGKGTRVTLLAPLPQAAPKA